MSFLLEDPSPRHWAFTEVLQQVWTFRKTGARYVIMKARVSEHDGQQVIEELMMENLEDKRRHWVTLPGLIRKYEKGP